jgi:3-deoxy-D-arabino-heptulosonate 7-phosphate (DAHP) synthase class II
MRQSLAGSSRNRTDFQNQAEVQNQTGHAVLERRKHRRIMTRLGGCLRPSLSDQMLRYCDILDVSANGAQIRTTKPLAADSWVTLGIEQLGKIHAQVVWQKDNLAGVQFAADPSYITRMMRGILPVPQTAA